MTVDPNQLATTILNLAINCPRRDADAGGKLMLETGSAYLDEKYASATATFNPAAMP